MLETLDAAAVRRWCGGGLEALRAHQREIDELNVFPVPDGDTGTNLVLTLTAAQEAVERFLAGFPDHPADGPLPGRPGGSTAPGSSVGGSTVGGSTAPGSSVGGSTVGGSTAPGSSVGGSTVGGSSVGGSSVGGSAAPGSVGGSVAGGSAAGSVGGSAPGGSAAGGSAAERPATDGVRAEPAGAEAGAGRLAGRSAGPGDVMRRMARGALLGARGNSGVIVSQILRGMADSFASSVAVRGGELARALHTATEAAYGAVARPVEGTVLSVVAAAADGAGRIRSDDLLAVARAAARSAGEALARTPQQLPALARAGVVDAGGRGLCLLLDALVEALGPAAGPATGDPPAPGRAATAATGDRPDRLAARAGNAADGLDRDELADAVGVPSGGPEPAGGDRGAAVRSGATGSGSHPPAAPEGAAGHAGAMGGRGPDAGMVSGHGPETGVVRGHGLDAGAANGQGPEARVVGGRGPDAGVANGQGLEARVVGGRGPDAGVANGQGLDAEAMGGDGPDPAGTFGYEVQYLLDAEEPAVERLRESLAGMGDSLVVVGTGDGAPPTWNVHVHVPADRIGPAVEVGVAAGRPYRISVTPLDDRVLGHRPTTPRPSQDGPRGAVVVAAGDGLAALFEAEGAIVVDRNPSTAEMLAAITATHSGSVVLLPNDSNTHAVARAAAREAERAGFQVSVVPTRSPVQAVAALAVRDAGRAFADDVIAMAEAAGACRYGEVCTAARAALTVAGPCRAGDLLGLVDGEVHVIGADLEDVSRRLLDRMLGGGGELVTLVLGADAPDGLDERLRGHVTQTWPFVEVQSYAGGQPRYHLLVGVE